MDLGAAVLLLAEANGLTQSNVRSQLSQALRDAYEALVQARRDAGDYCGSPWLVDIVGDDLQGNIVYEYDGDLLQCGYLITSDGTTRKTTLSISGAVEVMPRTVYDLDGGTTIESKRSGRRSFGESIRLELFDADVPLTEAKAKGKAYRIKVIQAGQGSSAFYPKEVLQRDGPKVFKAGTKMYYNHPTRAEEATRPEGDLHNFAAVFTSDAQWDEAGPKGPGLYAWIDVFSDFVERIAERAAEIGVSIRAYGEAIADKAGTMVLQSFSRAESVDFVTWPGAGGAVLTESAKGAISQQESNDMTKEDIQALILEGQKPLVAQIDTLRSETTTARTETAAANKRANVAEARSLIAQELGKLNEALPVSAKLRISDSILGNDLPVNESGVLDTVKLNAKIAEAVKAEADYIAQLTGRPVVTGMGTAAATEAVAPEVARKGLQETVLRDAQVQTTQKGVAEAFAASFAGGRYAE